MEENLDYIGKLVYVKFRRKVGRVAYYGFYVQGYAVNYSSAPWQEVVTDIKKHCIFLCPLDLYLLTGKVTDV